MSHDLCEYNNSHAGMRRQSQALRLAIKQATNAKPVSQANKPQRFVFTPRRNFREGTASGRLTIGFERIRWRPISPRHIAGSDSRVLDMQTIKQLQRFYVDEVFRPQPPIPGSQGSETVSLPCETSAFDRGEYTKQIQRVFAEGSSPSTHTRSRFPLHPTPPGCGWSIHRGRR